MSAILAFTGLTLRLNLRNPMALIYGYAFPLVFLAAFAVIYRHDAAPLIGHLGELLTVTALGGACFGLPTTVVAERERGVWRRYRATPTGAGSFVAGLVLSRLVLLVTAALLQLILARFALFMPMPRDPLGLLIAFLATSLALIGLGLIVAMLASSVPAVQALGQCIFLPMLMLGGVAIRLASLPDWAQRLAAFFPGRYAVEAMQATASGAGLRAIGSDLLTLAGFTFSGALIAASLFRWDSHKRRADRPLLLAGLALWFAIGAVGAWTDSKAPPPIDDAPVAPPSAYLRTPTPPPVPTPTPMRTEAREARPTPAPTPTGWQAITAKDIARIAFDRLPDDEGLVSPMAPRGTLDDEATAAQIAQVREALADWPPAHVADPAQRVRNLLFIAAVPDVLQIDPLERHLPWLIFDRLRQEVPPADLPRLLFWISQHPEGGDDSAVAQIDVLGLPTVSGPTDRVRERVMIYALKYLERLSPAH